MAGPTTAVLDDFNRADGALGANWPSSVIEFNTKCVIVSNAAKAADASRNDARWTASFGPDSEAYGTVSIVPANTLGQYLYVRIANPNSATMNCYAIKFTRFDGAPDTRVAYQRFDSGVATTLGANETGFPSPVAGQKYFLDATGSTITGHLFDSGAWTDISSRSDATYSAAGYIGMGFQSNSAGQMDDFGGGTVVVVSGNTYTETGSGVIG